MEIKIKIYFLNLENVFPVVDPGFISWTLIKWFTLEKSCFNNKKFGLLLPSGPIVNNNSSELSSILSLSRNALYPEYPETVYWYESLTEKSEESSFKHYLWNMSHLYNLKKN